MQTYPRKSLSPISNILVHLLTYEAKLLEGTPVTKEHANSHEVDIGHAAPQGLGPHVSCFAG